MCGTVRCSRCGHLVDDRIVCGSGMGGLYWYFIGCLPESVMVSRHIECCNDSVLIVGEGYCAFSITIAHVIELSDSDIIHHISIGGHDST